MRQIFLFPRADFPPGVVLKKIAQEKQTNRHDGKGDDFGRLGQAQRHEHKKNSEKHTNADPHDF